MPSDEQMYADRVERLLITGSRNWTDYEVIAMLIRDLPENSIVIHGGAPGADTLAQRAAAAQGVHTARVDALWRTYGKSAGPLRNHHMMLLQPTQCAAFPLGESRGTRHMMSLCVIAGIPIINYGDPESRG